jgi:uncharacterized protein YbjT (DUF2867 family)
MRAFVAGATGYTGREVVRELRAHGVPAVAHVRPDNARLAEWEARFQAHYAVVDTTPWELHAMRETLLRWQPTHVFALLGTTRSRVRSAQRAGGNDSYQTVDYGLSAMLLQALQLTGFQARFIYLSSVGVSERSRAEYMAVRWRMESELRTSGVPHVIARPAFISGDDRDDFRLTERVLARMSDGFFNTAAMLGVKKLRDRFGSLTGSQLARALVIAGLDPRHTNVTLEASDLRRLASE